MATITIARRDVASASTCVWSRKIASAGTNRMPPPTPDHAADEAAREAEEDHQEDVHQLPHLIRSSTATATSKSANR